MNAWMVRYTSLRCDALLQHLVAIYVDKLLRDTGQESGAEAGDFRPLASSVKKSGEVLGEELNIGCPNGLRG